MTKTLITLMTAGLLIAAITGSAAAQSETGANPNVQLASLATQPQADDVAAAKALRAFLAAQRPAPIAAADPNGPRR